VKHPPIDDIPFPDRLAVARRTIAGDAARPPAHIADQLDAAGREVRVMHDRLGTVLPVLEPVRRWYQRQDDAPPDEVRAYLVAAVLGCLGRTCPHLRRGGPQPAIARLPLRRLDCVRCSPILRRPPPVEADRCDVCGRRGVIVFQPFAVRLGPSLIAGDACRGCACVFGIAADAAS